MNTHEACNIAMAYLSQAWRMNSYTRTTTAATLHTCHAHLPVACQLPTKVCAVLPGSLSRFSAYSTMCKQINFSPHASDTQAAALECHAHIGSPDRHTTCENWLARYDNGRSSKLFRVALAATLRLNPAMPPMHPALNVQDRL